MFFIEMQKKPVWVFRFLQDELVLVLTGKCEHVGAYSAVIQTGCDMNTDNPNPLYIPQWSSCSHRGRHYKHLSSVTTRFTTHSQSLWSSWCQSNLFFCLLFIVSLHKRLHEGERPVCTSNHFFLLSCYSVDIILVDKWADRLDLVLAQVPSLAGFHLAVGETDTSFQAAPLQLSVLSNLSVDGKRNISLHGSIKHHFIIENGG